MNEAMNETFTVKNGQEEVNASLAELLNVDMSTVEALEGFKKTPRGNYTWQIQATSGGDSIADKPVIIVRCLALACTRLIDENGNDIDPAAGVGTEHDEMFFINDLEMGLGRFKFFLESAGMQSTGTAAANLLAATGGIFESSVMWQRDKNDKDKIYSRLDKIIPAQGVAAAQPAAVASQPAGNVDQHAQQAAPAAVATQSAAVQPALQTQVVPAAVAVQVAPAQVAPAVNAVPAQVAPAV